MRYIGQIHQRIGGVSEKSHKRQQIGVQSLIATMNSLRKKRDSAAESIEALQQCINNIKGKSLLKRAVVIRAFNNADTAQKNRTGRKNQRHIVTT